MAFRFRIDDVFSISGRGTVLTGEVISGDLTVQETVVVLGDDDRQVLQTVVTGLSVRGASVRSIRAGQVAGLVLRGVERADVRPGWVVLRADERPGDGPGEGPVGGVLPRLPSVPADTPLLLLPLRVETRFGPGRLRIRAWPDDVHVDAFEERLTPDEVALVTRLRQVQGRDRDTRYAAVVTMIGEPRARLLLDVADSGAAPDTVEDPWTMRPTARLLPERLIAIAHTDDGRRFAAEGRPVPPDGLAVAPGPDDEGAIGPGDPMAWMSDFDEALRVGMAIELQLPADVDRIARLTVLGVSVRHDGEDVRSLLRAHAHTGGLDVQPPLAPTKGDGAGPWAGQRGPGPRRALAAALGVDDVPLPDHAVDTAALERAARRVVWEAAVRPALVAGLGLDDSLVAGSDDEALLVQLAERYVELVDAYGPLPTLLVGAQPYGVLPVTPTAALARSGVDDRLAAQHEVVTSLALAARRARDAERADGGWLSMLKALERQPSGQSWRARPLIPGDVAGDWLVRSGAVTEPGTRGAVEQLRRALLHVRLSMSAFGLPDGGLLGDCVHSSRAYRLCAPLVADGAEGPDRPGGVPDRLDPHYLRELLAGDLVHETDGERDGDRPRPVLDLLAEAAVLQVLGDIAAQRSGPTPRPPGAGERTEPERPSRRRRLVGQTFRSTGPVTDLLVEAGQGRGARAGDARSTADALQLLSATPPVALHAAVAAALDLASSRIDAWITSFATEELRALRGRNSRALAVGAWGVVEDLAPAPEPGPQPFVLAPSMDHAGTAALLHQARGGLATTAPDLLQLDLSAAAVRSGRRLAAQLRRGTSAGQSLGVLAAEGLRDQGRGLDIPDVAAAYPMREAVRPEDPAAAGTAADAAARTARIDGLALLAGGADPAGAALGDALAVVRDGLHKAVAGLRDLLLAEGAHALAQGRPEAAAAALDGLVSGAPPPDRLDVVDPVRGGDALALAVALAVPAGAPPPADADLVTTLLPGLAAPVAALVGPLSGPVEVTARTPDGAEERQVLDLGDLGMSPLEVALLARPGHDPLAALAPRAVGLAERRLGVPLAHARVGSSRGTEDSLWAAARAGELLAAARPLRDADVSDPERPAPADAPAVHEAAVEQRATVVLTARRDALLGEAADVEAAAGDVVDLDELRTALDDLRVLAVPAAGYPLDERGDAAALVARAHRAAATLTARLDAAAELEEGRRLPALLPDTPVPGLATTEPTAWTGASGLRGTSPVQLAAWIEQTQAVRPRIAPLADLLLAGADDRAPLRVVQWPVRQASTADPVDWVGAQMLEDDVHSGHSSLLACGLTRDTTPATQLTGLVIDRWDEVVPSRQTTVGIAARAPAPPARAPQALLLAVPPTPDTTWTTEMLANLVDDTVRLAAARTVDLRELPPVGQARTAGTPARFDGLGWLLPLLWVPDHETDLRQAACPPAPERENLP